MEYAGDNKAGLPIYYHKNGWSVIVNIYANPIEVRNIVDRENGVYLGTKTNGKWILIN